MEEQIIYINRPVVKKYHSFAITCISNFFMSVEEDMDKDTLTEEEKRNEAQYAMDQWEEIEEEVRKRATSLQMDNIMFSIDYISMYARGIKVYPCI